METVRDSLTSGSPRAWIAASAEGWDGLAHDNEAGPLEMRDEALGDDLRCDLGCLIPRQARATGQRQSKASFDVARIGGRELVIHEPGPYREHFKNEMDPRS